jgi:hypothetical protein
MTAPSERFKSWIEGLSESWGDKLRGWSAKIILNGLEKTFDSFEPDFRDALTPSLQRLKAIEGLPDDIKSILEKAETQPKAVQFAFLLPLAIGLLAGAGMGMARPMMNIGSYQLDKFVHSARLDPASVITAWRRDPEKYEHFFNDLKEQGLSDERVEALKFVTQFYPSAGDLINWVAKEVFEPDLQAIYGLTDEFELLDLAMFAKAGMTEEQAKNFWIAHWNYPSIGQIFDMYHRGELTKEDIVSYMRLAEIPPYWRDKLDTISWDLPNRIELRMMARYGLVDKAFLLNILEKVGLHEDYRSIAADMMLVMGIQSDLSTRYGKGWITSGDVKSELAKAGLDANIQERVYQWIVKQSATERVTTEKNLTKAEIVKGVKKGTISRKEGEGLLVEMGYDAKEATFIMDINIPAGDTTTEVKQRELTKSDIINAYKLGQIDEADVVSGLMSIRYSEDDANFLLSLTNATLEKIEEVKERNLTKADIIKGVKNGVISQEEGYTMLINIGYSDEDSNFILSVNPTTTAGSPDTFNEFLAMTQSYKASLGLPTKEVTPDIIQAERDVKTAQAALKTGTDAKAKVKRIRELELAVEQAKQRYSQLVTVPEQKKVS